MLTIIATERKNAAEVEHFVAKRFEGFSITDSCGFWRGVKEDSMFIWVAGRNNEADVRELCKEINVYNNQECCMVLRIPCNVEFV